MPSFLVELKKRRVYRVAIGYAVAAWLMVQIAATVLPAYHAPDWILPILITLIALGFPVALVLAWAFDLTPLGIRSDPGTGARSTASNRGAWLVASFGLAVGGLALGGYWLWHSRPAQPPGQAGASLMNAIAAIPAKSIAVLPFQNMSDDKQNAYFADGVQEEILTTLAKVADLKVTSRTSVMQFRDAEKRDLRGIAQQLGVAYLLEGSVRRAANHVRVTAKLIDARIDFYLWADQYEGELADVFGFQTEIAQKIAGQLKAALSPNEQAAIQSQPTLNTAAYDLYLRARELVRGGKDDLPERVRLLDEAVARDPAFVQALCLLAQVHLLAYWQDEDHTPARLERARKALDAAARLRPDAGEVHLARALFHYWGNREYAPALAELALAGRNLPNDADVLYFTGLIERRQGRWEESTATWERALVLDPRNSTMASDPVSNYRTTMANDLVINYCALRRYDVAKRSLDNLLAWKPGDAGFQTFRALIDWYENADLRRLQKLFSGDAPAIPDKNMLATNRPWVARLQRDYRAADQAFSEYRLLDLSGSDSVITREYEEGIIARGLGDAPRAEAAFLRAREHAAASVAARPSDAKALSLLARIDAKLGRKEEAVREAERAVALLPVASDAVLGPILLSDLATVYAAVGETDQSLDVLQQAVALPCGPSYGYLQLDEDFDPVRQDPRFQKILASVAPKSSPP